MELVIEAHWVRSEGRWAIIDAARGRTVVAYCDSRTLADQLVSEATREWFDSHTPALPEMSYA